MFQRLSVELLVMAGIGLILGLLGPFGTYPMPLALRLAYWIGFILIGYTIFRPVTRAAGWLHEQSRIPFYLAIAIAVAVAAVPLSLMIGFTINGMRFDGPMLSSGFALLYLQCAGIGFAIFMLMRLVFPNEVRDGKAGSDVSTMDNKNLDADKAVAKPKIFNRLPIGFPEPVYALSVEDHYVRVHAADRSEMLLLRLSDAIAEMGDTNGTQVHRSWWVARTALVTGKRKGRNWQLVLKNGLEAPVSRSHVAKLKKMGWI